MKTSWHIKDIYVILNLLIVYNRKFIFFSANRACCGKFAQLLIDWCRMDDNNEILMQESIGFCNRSVQHCIYWLVKLFVKCVSI